jgi:heat shock protein HslJ
LKIKTGASVSQFIRAHFNSPSSPQTFPNRTQFLATIEIYAPSADCNQSGGGGLQDGDFQLNSCAKKMACAATAIFMSTSGVAFADGRNTLDSTWFYDGGKPVADMTLPTITLDQGKISGTDSCNRIIGSYTLKGKRGIRFMAAGTKMLCADMTMADTFNSGITAARSYTLSNGKLMLRGKSGKTVLILNRINK